METQCLCRAEIKIVDCIKLNERKDLRKKQSHERKKGRTGDKEREETERKHREQAGV